MNNKTITIAVVMFVLILAGAIIYAKNTGLAVKDIPSEEVAKWIGEHSVLYVQAGCHACKVQEDLFGENYKYLNTVDCLKDIQACINLGIEATPTWIIDGEKYVGVQSIEKLKELTGYQG